MSSVLPPALRKLRKQELLVVAEERGLRGLETLRRFELLDLLQKLAGQQAPPKSPKAARRKRPKGIVRAPNGRVMPRSVAELPSSPLQLDERLVLLPRDTQTLFAYWSIDTTRLAATRTLELQLFVVDSERASPIALRVNAEPWARSWYLPVLAPERLHRVELGYQDTAGKWQMLLRSNDVRAPAVEVASVGAPRYAEQAAAIDAYANTFEPGAAREPDAAPAPEPNLLVVGGRRASPLPDGVVVATQSQRDQRQVVALPAEIFGPGPLRIEGSPAAPRDAHRGLLEGGDARAFRRLLRQAAHDERKTASSPHVWPSGPAISATRPTSDAQPTRGASAPQRASTDGALALVLHAHLPFVRHPEHEVFLEEDWLYEAIVECYLPLLELCERLVRQGVDYHFTLALSPPLVAMLGDELLRDRMDRHFAWLDRLVEREARRLRGDEAQTAVVEHYRTRLATLTKLWQAHQRDLPSGFAALERSGHLDLMTCAATHGYLPLLGSDQAVRAQLRVAVAQHEAIFGQPPSGIWLPECAYTPGLDAALAACGLRYFVADTHAVERARPHPRFGSAAPLLCPGSGVAVFARDPSASEQVWSRELGYPGDPVYRDFYRDIGWELPREALTPLVPDEGPRKTTGLKYRAITGAGAEKHVYEPTVARQRADEHAAHFVAARRRQLAASPAALEAPLVVAPYDAELFGHWWHEGPCFLEQVLRRCAEAEGPKTVHLRGYLAAHPRQQIAEPAASSWGAGGQHAFWLNDDNAWIYPELHRSAQRMSALASRFETPTPLEERALAQSGRELLLAQASDWAFLIHAGTAADYARARTRTHLDAFAALATQLEQQTIDAARLATLEGRDNLFAELDYRVWA